VPPLTLKATSTPISGGAGCWANQRATFRYRVQGSNGTENRFNKLLDLKPLIGNILRDGTHVRRLLWFGDSASSIVVLMRKLSFLVVLDQNCDHSTPLSRFSVPLLLKPRYAKNPRYIWDRSSQRLPVGNHLRAPGFRVGVRTAGGTAFPARSGNIIYRRSPDPLSSAQLYRVVPGDAFVRNLQRLLCVNLHRCGIPGACGIVVGNIFEQRRLVAAILTRHARKSSPD
jgi:hypothetical protein